MAGSAVVIGAGLGGLCTAARLRREGWEVTVLEKNSHVGGRYNVIREQGFTFDTGPTLLLMRDVLEQFFRDTDTTLEAYLDLVRVHPNYEVRFADGFSLEFSSDLPSMELRLESIEAGAGAAFRRYLADAAYKYRVARERFVERNFVHLRDFITAANLYYLFTTNTLRKLDRHTTQYFHDPHLVAAFTFQTMYLGLSPHDAPAIYSLLPYTELCEGIWFPRGGMYQVVSAILQRCRELGVRVETDTEVRRVVTKGRRARVELADGNLFPADVVVCNADLPYAYQTLIPSDGRGASRLRLGRRLDHGSSAFLMYLGTDQEYPQLHHHNVYLSGDLAGNFGAIFQRFELPRDPSLYICAATRTDPSLAPPGHEAIYVLVPVPRLAPPIDWRRDRDRFRDRVYERLSEVGLPDLREHVVFERVYTPQDFASDYNLLHGSAFGLSHGFRQIGYLRPSNKARFLDNVYFVGASTVPGGGVPMVILGSRLTAERVTHDHS